MNHVAPLRIADVKPSATSELIANASAVAAEAASGPKTLFSPRNGSLASRSSSTFEVVARSASKRRAMRSVPHNVMTIAKLSAA